MKDNSSIETDRQQREETEEETKRLGLVSSPELPEEIANSVSEDLPDLLSRYVDDRVSWEVKVVADPLTGVAGDSLKILDETERCKQEEGWEYAVCITDLPIFHNRRLVVADASVKRNVAMISLPSLGATPMKRRVREAIIQLANEMYHGSSEQARSSQEKQTKKRDSEDDSQNIRGQGAKQLMGQRLAERLSPIKRKTYDEDSEFDVRFLVDSKISGSIRMTSGMVLANRPWTIFPSFKRVVAGAFATGAYGLIFPTLWLLSGAYGTPRFMILMITAMSAMVIWIIVAHHLWETVKEGSSRYLVRLYNVATALTLIVGVLFYYSVLFLLFLIAVSIFVPAGLLESELGHEVSFADYVSLAWLTTSIATVVGAVGAGLESEETVLKTTYGYRQRRRKEWQKQQEKEANNNTSSE
ncbi:hypothetical protein ACFPU1_12955 [Thalassorhabdus alkalitolerans]|uniref:5,10-methylene-tetrahydrofolate dehydrogenase n=1 Tax=Thalassorhabdus alkalitolerans TaxID=2282697 RepID=A0ABW0YRE7_9BACI